MAHFTFSPHFFLVFYPPPLSAIIFLFSWFPPPMVMRWKNFFGTGFPSLHFRPPFVPRMIPEHFSRPFPGFSSQQVCHVLRKSFLRTLSCAKWSLLGCNLSDENSDPTRNPPPPPPIKNWTFVWFLVSFSGPSFRCPVCPTILRSRTPFFFCWSVQTL